MPAPAAPAALLFWTESKQYLDDPTTHFTVTLFIDAWQPGIPAPIRDAITLHPRAAAWRRDPFRMCRDYQSTFRGGASGYYTMEEVDRVSNALRLLGHWRQTTWTPRLRRTWRLLFVLYPALRFWMQRRLEDYYAPGGRGYQAAKRRFEAQQSKEGGISL
jgi:hypothetical protein